MGGTRERILDELLVLRAREGGREAFQMLVTRWQERLWRHAWRLLGREDVAWDVLQDAWLHIVRSLDQLADPAHFRRWAYTIVTRRAADWLRRNGRDEDHARWPEDEGPGAPPPDGAREVAVERLRRALRRLDPERRAILALCYLEGFDGREIAAILDLPHGTVRSRLHGARRELREILERMEEE